MEHRNLKNGTDKLVYYKTVETGDYDTATQYRNGEQRIITKPVMKKIYFTEEQVKEFSLNELGKNMEWDLRQGQFTQIPNYYIRFWQPFIKAEGLALFLTLLSFCFDKDYCYTSYSKLALYSGKSVNTVKKHLNTLEQYSFIYRFNVKNANTDKVDLEEAPIIKVRQRVPFLSKKELDTLPEPLRLEHDKFMERYMHGVKFNDLIDQSDYTEAYKSLLDQGKEKKINDKQLQKRIALKNSYSKLVDHLQPEELHIFKATMAKLKDRMSKPTFETWFNNSVIQYRGGQVRIYVANSFIKEWLEEHYQDLIQQIIEDQNLSVQDVTFITYGATT